MNWPGHDNAPFHVLDEILRFLRENLSLKLVAVIILAVVSFSVIWFLRTF